VDALKLKRKRVQKSVVQVYVIPVGVPVKNAWAVVKELRASGVAADLDFKGKGASKAFRYADAYGISYVCLIGENEVKKKKVMLKNLGTGEQKLVTVAQVVKKVVG
jgi:histidyl-tRNA synthetase